MKCKQRNHFGNYVTKYVQYDSNKKHYLDCDIWFAVLITPKL